MAEDGVRTRRSHRGSADASPPPISARTPPLVPPTILGPTPGFYQVARKLIQVSISINKQKKNPPSDCVVFGARRAE
jgi:hypothetical protein